MFFRSKSINSISREGKGRGLRRKKESEWTTGGLSKSENGGESS
jgi:hypothetical protein